MENWAEFYRTLLSTARIPAVSSWEFTRSHGVIRDLHVDLAEALDQFRKKVPQPAMLTICADVVTLPKDFRPTIEKLSLVIAARRIEFASNSRIDLDLRKTPRAGLKLFASEIVKLTSRLPVTVLDPWGNDKPIPDADQNITPKGLLIVCFDEQVTGSTDLSPKTTIKTGAGMGSMLGEDSTLALSLASIFHAATVLYDNPDHAATVAAQLAWITACAAQSPLQAGLMMQSAGLLAMVQSRTPGATFVPELSRTVYAETARAHVPQLLAYERQYERFEDQAVSVDDRIKAAKLLLAKSEDAVNLSQSLIGQATSNLTNATTALETAQTNVQKQQVEVEKAGGQFQVSAEWWFEKQKFEASVQIITAVIKSGAAIGRIACGDVTSGPAAVDGALQDLGKLAGAGGAGDLANTLALLKKMLLTLGQVFELARKLVKAGTALDSMGSLASELAAPGLIDIGSAANGPEAWDIFGEKAGAAMKPATDNQINGSGEYLLQLRILVVQGKALSAARAAVVQLGQELLRLRLIAATHVREKDRLQQYINDLETTREVKAGLRQMFFQRYLDAKRSLFVALEQYRASYVYWALSPSMVKPSLTDRVSVFENGLNDLAQMTLDNESALRRFAPPPQKLTQSFLINDTGVLATLKSSRNATWTIPLDAPALTAYDRVRVTKVRVWLIGAKQAPAADSLHVEITNSGSYLDRKRERGQRDPVKFTFVAKPLARVFSYTTKQSSGTRVEVEPGMPAWVVMDGKVHDEVSYAYFVPTVFSQWSIRLPQSTNPGLDLSGVTGIRMDVEGSAIPATGLQAAATAKQTDVLAGAH